MRSIAEALQQILPYATPLASESVDLLQAYGRILQEEIHAPHDFPSFTNSAMDGYAVRSAETQDASQDSPVALQVTQEIPASHWPEQEVKPGEAARIFTGAPVPPGSDAVELQENIRRDGDTIYLEKPVPADKSLRHQGSNAQQGEVILPKGSWLQAGEIGILASIGRTRLQVTRRPRVAILSCGDELVEVDGTPKPGQVLESNRYNLACQVQEAGGEPILLPLAPDRPDALLAAIKEGLKADVLVSSGGASVGDYDLIRPTLQQLGVTLDFWKVAIKPGKPLMFGSHQDCLIFGLPGNPASSLVTFEVFVRPTLRKLAGHVRLFRPRMQAHLQAPTRPTRGRTHLVRGSINWNQDEAWFTPHLDQGSGNLLSIRGIEAFGLLPPGTQTLEPPAQIEVMLVTPMHQSEWDAK